MDERRHTKINLASAKPYIDGGEDCLVPQGVHPKLFGPDEALPSSGSLLLSTMNPGLLRHPEAI